MTATIPIGVRAAMVRRVLNEPGHSVRIALPAIASHFSTTLVQLQAVLHDAGYPDRIRMERNALHLEEEAATALADAHHARDEAAAGHPVAPAADKPPAQAQFSSGPPAAPTTGEAVEGQRLMRVAISELHVDQANLRKLPSSETPDIIELADTIASAGLLQPIVVRRQRIGGATGARDRLVVVMGHRRLVAIRDRLHWDTADVIVRGGMTEAEVLEAMLIENGQRVAIDPIAEAKGIARLMALEELTEAGVGRRIGRSAPFVASRLDLLKLSPEDRARVAAGELSIGAAVSAVRHALGTRRGKTGVDRNWHLGPTHRLAEAVRAMCDTAGHVTGRKLGAIGCGECWEDAIRLDERRRLEASAVMDRIGEEHRAGAGVVA